MTRNMGIGTYEYCPSKHMNFNWRGLAWTELFECA